MIHFHLIYDFICLKNDYIQNIENVLKKYQISIKHILNADYVKSIENEVLIIPKLSKNKGFFERFFNFFS